MSRETTIPAIPPLVGLSPELVRVLGPIKQALEVRLGHIGESLDKAVTLRDLEELKLTGSGDSASSGGVSVVQNPSTSGSDTVNYSKPDTITGFTATGAMTTIILEWNAVDAAYVQVWRSESDDFGTATMVGTTRASVYSDAVGQTGVTRYYWVRAVSTGGTLGDLNAANGTPATTGLVMSDNLADLIVTAEKLASGAVDWSSHVTGAGKPDDDADVTGEHTAADTARVDGIVASLIRQTLGSTWSNGFEESEFADWSNASYNSGVLDSDAFSGSYAALITTASGHSADSSGTTSGFRVEIPEQIALQLGGKRVRVTVFAKQPSSNAASELAIAYSTNDAGDSGWNVFTPGASYAPFSFVYDVPEPIVGGSGYLGIWGDTSDAGLSALIDRVSINIETDESSLDALSLINAPAEAGATLGATWGSNIFDQPAEEQWNNALQEWADILGTEGMINTSTATTLIESAAIVGALIANATIGTAHIQEGSITNALIGTAAITSAKIAEAAIGSAAIAELVVNTAHIVNSAITNAKIADAAIDNAKISNLSAAKVTFGTMSGNRIAVNTLSGNRLVANTVTAEKMAAGTITAASGVIADATIGTAQIQNLAVTNGKIQHAAVDTLHLAGQAVTIPVSSYTSGIMYQSSSSWATAQSATIASTGAPIAIIASLSFKESGNGTRFYKARIRRGGTVIFEMPAFEPIVTGETFSYSISNTPGAGSYTYYIQTSISANTNIQISARSLVLLETKR
jgi:hypothetical protein